MEALRGTSDLFQVGEVWAVCLLRSALLLGVAIGVWRQVRAFPSLSSSPNDPRPSEASIPLQGELGAERLGRGRLAWLLAGVSAGSYSALKLLALDERERRLFASPYQVPLPDRSASSGRGGFEELCDQMKRC